MTARDVDPLLAAMRRVAAEESERDARLASLEKLAERDLAAEERRALEEQAARAPDGAELAELLRPLDAPARANAAAAALAALRGDAALHGDAALRGEEKPSRSHAASKEKGLSGAASAAPSTASSKNGGASSSEGLSGAASAAPSATSSRSHAASKEEGLSGAASAAPSNVVSLAARAREKSTARPRAGRWAAIGGALALAAGVALFVSTRGAGVELPAYEASLAGGVRDVRADDAARTFLPGKPLRVRLRPEHAVAGRVAVVVALRQGDRVARLDAAIEALEGGALSVQATLPAAPIAQPGPAELTVLVADPQVLKAQEPPEDLADAPNHRVVRVPIVIGAP